MPAKIGTPLILSTTLLVSGCSLDSYIQEIKDYLYLLNPEVKDSNICPDHHYFKADEVSEEIKDRLEGKITYFYWLGSNESKKADAAFDRLTGYFEDQDIAVDRLPAINDSDWLESAQWAIALSDLGLENDRDLVRMSYDYFEGNLPVEEFNSKLMSLGKSPHLFHELKTTAQHTGEIVKLGEMTYRPGIEKIPAIVIDSSYIIYPSDFIDMRDAWISAGYVFNNHETLSSACAK